MPREPASGQAAASAPAEPGQRKGNPRPAVPPAAPGRILIVDDEEDVRESMRDVLCLLRPDLDVVVCAGSAQALALLRTQPRFSAVLTDYHMPGRDGLAFIESAHAMDPSLPIVLATAYAGHEARDEALRSGALAVLAKPFTAAELVDAVAAALARLPRMPHVRSTRTGVQGHASGKGPDTSAARGPSPRSPQPPPAVASSP